MPRSSIPPCGMPNAISSCACPRRRPRLDPAAHRIETDGGDLAYDAVLLAMGASPRSLPLEGHDLDGVHTLRRLDDSDALAEELRGGGRRLVLIGSGWIGMEVAATARTLGNEVTILERDPVPLALAVGPRMGEVFRRLHEENGVDLRAERPGRADRGRESAEGVVVDGETVPADLVLIGVGAVPNTALAEAPGSRSTTASSPMHRSHRARPTCTRPVMSPTPTIPSSSGTCAASTGTTRSRRDRSPRG